MVANKKAKKAARVYAVESGVPYRQARREEQASFTETDHSSRIAELLRESISIEDFIGQRVSAPAVARPEDFLAVPLPEGIEHAFVSGFSLGRATVATQVIDTYDDGSCDYRARIEGAIIAVTVTGDGKRFNHPGENHRYEIALYYSGVLDQPSGGLVGERLAHLERPRLNRIETISTGPIERID